VFDGATGGFVVGNTTDAAGNYNTGQVLAPGQYKVTGNLAGSETIAYNNKFSVATGDPVTVTAGATTTGINLALPSLGGIMGHVTDAASGLPLQNVTILLWDAATLTSITQTATAADGSYTINGLNPLQGYKVRAILQSAGNFATVFANSKPSLGTGDVITVPAGGTTTVDFSLAAGGGITGQVTDVVTHAPVSGVFVEVFDGSSTNISIHTFLINTFMPDVNGNFKTVMILSA